MLYVQPVVEPFVGTLTLLLGHRHDSSWIVVRLASTAKPPWPKLAAD